MGSRLALVNHTSRWSLSAPAPYPQKNGRPSQLSCVSNTAYASYALTKVELSGVMTSSDRTYAGSRDREIYILGATAACEAVYVHLPKEVAQSLSAWLIDDFGHWHGGDPPPPRHEPPSR